MYLFILWLWMFGLHVGLYKRKGHQITWDYNYRQLQVLGIEARTSFRRALSSATGSLFLRPPWDVCILPLEMTVSFFHPSLLCSLSLGTVTLLLWLGCYTIFYDSPVLLQICEKSLYLLRCPIQIFCLNLYFFNGTLTNSHSSQIQICPQGLSACTHVSRNGLAPPP